MRAPARKALHLEMGLTRDEFLRLLPLAVGAASLSVDAEARTGRAGEVDWTLALTERPPRRIALLAVPVLAVDLLLSGPDGAALDAFVGRFLLAYQRAGG